MKKLFILAAAAAILTACEFKHPRDAQREYCVKQGGDYIQAGSYDDDLCVLKDGTVVEFDD